MHFRVGEFLIICLPQLPYIPSPCSVTWIGLLSCGQCAGSRNSPGENRHDQAAISVTIESPIDIKAFQGKQMRLRCIPTGNCCYALAIAGRFYPFQR